jgi:hypothetical protein
VDAEWAARRLTEFRDACARYEGTVPRGGYVGDRNLRAEMQRLEPTAKRILSELDSSLGDFGTEFSGGTYKAMTAAERGLGILADQDEVERHMRPAGPSLSANDLHPWVWQAAQAFWEAGKYFVAVEQAAKSINAHTQQKLGVIDLSDDDLLAQAWSEDEPKPRRPRLRPPGDPTDPTVRSRLRGARSFAQGCWAGIRNVAAHTIDNGDTPKQVALEFLAALSVLARWVDEADIHPAPSEGQ